MPERCSGCPREYECIDADGSQPCRTYWLSTSPGLDDRRVPWSGRAGKELNQTYLSIAGLSRSEIRLDNVVRCAMAGNRAPSPDLISTCSANHVERELWLTQPEIIILMGAQACSLSPEINLHVHHGILQYVPFFGEMRRIFPIHNPAAGLHDAKMMIPLLEDFESLRHILNTGRSNEVRNQFPNPIYEELTSAFDVECILNSPDTLTNTLGADTETVNNEPWCHTFSIEDGTGFMLHRDAKEANRTFNRLVNEQQRRVVMHHSLYARDVEFCKAMGVDYSNLLWADTAHLAYHLGNLPQGLKALGYRLLGVRMKDYEDLIMPYSRAAVIEWLQEALLVAELHPKLEYKEIKSKAKKYLEAPTTVYLDGVPHKEIAKPSSVYSVIKRILRYTEKPIDPNAAESYNPWRSWKEMDVEDNDEIDEERAAGREIIEKEVGKMPIASLEQVKDRQLVIEYAGQDSDVTRRLEPELTERCSLVGREVYSGDYDK